MDNFFIPYSGKKPASVVINGHRLVILSHDKAILEDDLDLLGADRIKEISSGTSDVEHDKLLGKIAKQVDGGVVLAPSGVELRDILNNLKSELPWVQ
jgi:hypothetical protein